MRDYHVLGMPTTLFITPEGRVSRSWTGALTKEKLSQLIQELLSASDYSGGPVARSQDPRPTCSTTSGSRYLLTTMEGFISAGSWLSDCS